MLTKPRIRNVIAGLFVMAGLSVTTPVSAQWVVISVSGAGIAPGTVIAPGQTLTLASGVQVKLLSQEGKTTSLSGPHSGPVSADKGEGGDAAAFKVISGFLQGQQQSTTILGTMRGTHAKPPSHELINADQPGQACILSAEANFWRKDAAETEAVVILDDAGEEVASATWEAGQPLLSFPASPFVDGKSYEIARDSRTTSVKMHLPSKPLPGTMEQTAWLASQGCRSQAKSLLEAL